MPAVLSRKEFDARLKPLYNNLVSCAEKHVGYDNAWDVVMPAVEAAWFKVASFAPHQDQEAFAVWLQAYLHNEIQHFISAQARQRETSLPATSIFELCDGPDAPHWEQDGWQAQRDELHRRLHNFALTTRQRDCCLRWIGGGISLQAIGALQEPPVTGMAVCKIIKRVGRMIQKVDDADTFDNEIGELIENMPQALTYAGQMQRDNRVRREANMFALKRALNREASRVAPRSVAPQGTPTGNRKARRTTKRRAA